MEISYEYIRGLIDGEGCFSFCSVPGPSNKKIKLPAFILRMSVRNKQLIESVRDKLQLKNKVYTYDYPLGKDGIKRQPQSVLIVRDFGSLKNTIIPLFYKKLHGYKRIQFKVWLEKMGVDRTVPRDYRLLSKLYKNGYYENLYDKFK